ncbi:thioesterase family protein [Nocardia yunnanensis]|uniref:thioesterase family protein n=1 Tax=Nocardia yunnanensis TaxID=2382165 RepID=UPI00165747F0|nr:thioesterase family protein [Nocardia yunnanensis]
MTEQPHYFRRVAPQRFAPTLHVGGAWDAGEQHVGPLAGLLVHELDRWCRNGGSGRLLSRVTFDILGPIALAEFDIHVETLRAGRTVELVEAVAVVADRPAVVARAWYSTIADTESVAGGQPPALPAPDAVVPWPLTAVWPGGYIASLDARPIGAPRLGRTAAWISTGTVLLVGEPVSELASFVALVDTANGIAVREQPDRWLFPNLDLTIHLYRQPRGRWVGLDASVTFGRCGQGLTSTVLHDIDGPVGHAQQTLAVRPR